MAMDPLGLTITIQINDQAVAAMGKGTQQANAFGESITNLQAAVADLEYDLGKIAAMDLSGKNIDQYVKGMKDIYEQVKKIELMEGDGGKGGVFNEKKTQARLKLMKKMRDEFKAINQAVEKQASSVENINEAYNNILKTGGDLSQISRRDRDSLIMSLRDLSAKKQAMESLRELGGEDLKISGEIAETEKALNFVLGDNLETTLKTLEAHKAAEKSAVKMAATQQKIGKTMSAIGAPAELTQMVTATSMLAAASVLLVSALKSVIDDQNAVRKATMRVSGTITELSMDMRNLSVSLGVSAEKAREVIVAFAEVGASRKEIEAYAESLAILSEATGANTNEAAMLQKRVGGLTGDMKTTNTMTNRLTASAKKLGLTTEDINDVIKELSESIYHLALAYGYTEKETIRFQDSLMALRASARSVGADGSAAMKLYTDAIKDPLAIKSMMMLGDNMDAFHEAVAKGDTDKSLRLYAESMRELGKDIEGGAVTAQEMARVFETSVAEVENMIKATENLDNKQKMARALKDIKAEEEAQKAFVDATNDLKSAFVKLWSVMQGVMKVLGPFVKILGTVVGWISKILSAVLDVDLGMGAWVNTLYQMIVVIGIFMGIGLARKILGGVSAVGKMTGALKSGIKWLWQWIFGKKVKVVAEGADTAAITANTAAQQANNAVTQQTAKGGKLLGKAAVNMLAFGAALLMVAGAAYLFAMAAEKVQDNITGLIAIVVVLFGLGAALIAVASIGSIAIVPLLGIAFALLMMGGAVFLAAYGMSFLVAELAKADPAQLFLTGLALYALAGAFVALGVATIFGALAIPALAALGIAIAVLGAVLWYWEEEIQTFANAMYYLAWAFKQLDATPVRQISNIGFGGMDDAAIVAIRFADALMYLANASWMAGLGLRFLGRGMPLATVKPTGAAARKEKDKEGRDKKSVQLLDEIKEKIPTNAEIVAKLGEILQVLKANPREMAAAGGPSRLLEPMRK